MKVTGRDRPFHHLRSYRVRNRIRPDRRRTTVKSIRPLPIISRTNDPSQRTNERTTPIAISTPPSPSPSSPPTLPLHSRPRRAREAYLRRSSELQIGKKMDDGGFEMQMSDFRVCLPFARASRQKCGHEEFGSTCFWYNVEVN